MRRNSRRILLKIYKCFRVHVVAAEKQERVQIVLEDPMIKGSIAVELIIICIILHLREFLIQITAHQTLALHQLENQAKEEIQPKEII